MELVFIGLVKECGLMLAQQWAIAIGLPHERSYAMLARLLYGPHSGAQV
jgi:hypothetical protein